MFGLPMSVIVGAMCAGLALPTLFWAISSPAGQAPLRERLKVYDPTDLRDIVLARGASERVVQPGIGHLADLARAISPAGFVDRLDRKIQYAGVGREWPLQRVLSTKLLLGAGFGTLLILRWATEPGNARLFVLSIIMTVGMFVLPDLFIGIKGQKRQEEIARSLPDVLDQITISVEAGLGFDAALGQVSTRVEGPLSEELGHTLQDIKVGMSRSQAFDALNRRTDVPELRQFVLAFQQAEKLGVPIAQVLRIQSAELRMIRRQKAEENAQKLPVKMIIPLVLFILPALIIVVIAPAAFKAMDAF